MNTASADYNWYDLDDISSNIVNNERVLRAASDELQIMLDKLNDVDDPLAAKLSDICNEMRYFLDQAERRAVEALRVIENA